MTAMYRKWKKDLFRIVNINIHHIFSRYMGNNKDQTLIKKNLMC